MTNRPFRPFDFDRDLKAVQRIWIECGWIDDEDDERAITADFFRAGEAEVATINDEAECSVHWTRGTLQYLDEVLPMGAVTAVTTSHISRKLGFARELTARALARQKEAGMLVSALGMFDQGFYDKVGFGSGPYETLVQFDPATLKVDARFRPPTRLTTKDYRAVHTALANRRMFHGSAVLNDPEIVSAELRWSEKPFGLGYFDGPDGALSHFFFASAKGENGPYTVKFHRNATEFAPTRLISLVRLRPYAVM